MLEYALHAMTMHTKHDAHLACEVGILLKDVLALCLQAIDLILLVFHGLIQLGDGLHSCLHLSGFRCTSPRMASEPINFTFRQVAGKAQAIMLCSIWLAAFILACTSQANAAPAHAWLPNRLTPTPQFSTGKAHTTIVLMTEAVPRKM